jgi:ribosome-binding factor A
MADTARARKLAGRIKQIVATGIETQIKDPRLGMVTVTDVRVTGDLHDATVFYTVFGDGAAQAASARALESARGVLRSEVGRQTGVRFTPTLTFVLDAVPETAQHINELLAVAAAADADVRAVRESARPAGEADPYRKPHDEDVPADAYPDADSAAEPAAPEPALEPATPEPAPHPLSP